jgi:hypothetical protein
VKKKGRITAAAAFMFDICCGPLTFDFLLLLLLRLVCMGTFLWITKMDFVGKKAMTRNAYILTRFLILRLFSFRSEQDVYTPLRRIFAVPYDLELDRDVIAEIYSEGYSRVPVYEKLPVCSTE